MTALGTKHLYEWIATLRLNELAHHFSKFYGVWRFKTGIKTILLSAARFGNLNTTTLSMISKISTILQRTKHDVCHTIRMHSRT